MANMVYHILVRDKSHPDKDREFMGQGASQSAAVASALSLATSSFGFVSPRIISVKSLQSVTGVNQLDF